MPDQITREELKEQILKDALVRSVVQRWEKIPGEPIKSSHQPIVEIGIDDLMSLIDQYTAERERLARIKYERSGMAFVHSTVIELFNDKKALLKLDNIVQEKLNTLTNTKKEETK